MKRESGMNQGSPLDVRPGRYWAWPPEPSRASRGEKRIRLAVLNTHPVQYQSPWFRALAKQPGLAAHIFYCYQPPAEQQGTGFGVPFSWDIPLLDGYSYSFLKNIARKPSTSHFSGLNTPEIGRVLATGEFDVVLVNGWHFRSAWQAMIACWRAGVPVIARGDSNLRQPRPLAKRLLKEVPFRAFIPRFAACAAVGEWSREYFLHYGAAPERVVTIPHTVDVARLQAEARCCKQRRTELEARFHLRPGVTTFALVAKLAPVKAPLDFIRAIASAAQHTTVQAVIIGDGPLRRECERAARDLNAPVCFAGFMNQSEIAGAYCAADAVVLTSATETWGIAINEAFACGRPCIISDRVGCGPDLVAGRGTGAVFRLNDTEELGKIMATMAAAPERLKEMGAEALNLSATFRPEAAAEATRYACEVALRDARAVAARAGH